MVILSSFACFNSVLLRLRFCYLEVLHANFITTKVKSSLIWIVWDNRLTCGTHEVDFLIELHSLQLLYFRYHAYFLFDCIFYYINFKQVFSYHCLVDSIVDTSKAPLVLTLDILNNFCFTVSFITSTSKQLISYNCLVYIMVDTSKAPLMLTSSDECWSL